MTDSVTISTLPLSAIVRSIRRRWLLGAVVALGCALPLVVAVLRLPPLFEARATLEVERGRRPVSFGGQRDDPALEVGELNTQRELLLSDRLLRRALADSGLGASGDYAGETDPVVLLRRRLQVVAKKDAWNLAATLRDRDPERARLALQSVVDGFLALASERERHRADEHVAFLGQQLQEARQRVEAARQAEDAFARAQGILVEDPERNHIAQRIQELETQGVQLASERAATTALQTQSEAAAALSEPAARQAALLRIDPIGRDAAVARRLDEVQTLEAQAVVLAQRYGPRHPRSIELADQLGERRRQLTGAIDQAQALIAGDHQRLGERQASLAARVASERDALHDYRRGLAQLADLRAATTAAAKIHQHLLDRLGEEQVALRLDQQRVALVDPPWVGAEPVDPRPTLLGLALAGALALGAAAALVADLVGRRVRGTAEAARLSGLPVLAVIPQADEPPPLLAEDGGVAEAVRRLRTALVLLGGDAACRVVLVASPSAGDGRTTVAAGLAGMLARSGAAVLLVDGDLRGGRLAQVFALPPGPGLAELLAGQPEVAPTATAIPGLDLLGAGALAHNPAELLHSHCLPEWLARCRKHYAFVVFDSSSLTEAAEPLLLAAVSDAVVVVVRDASTPRGAVAAAARALAPFADRLVGTVVNGLKRADAASDADVEAA